MHFCPSLTPFPWCFYPTGNKGQSILNSVPSLCDAILSVTAMSDSDGAPSADDKAMVDWSNYLPLPIDDDTKNRVVAAPGEQKGGGLRLGERAGSWAGGDPVPQASGGEQEREGENREWGLSRHEGAGWKRERV